MAAKEFDPDDPMEIVGVGLPEGEEEEMAACLLEEFIREGWDDEGVLRLFSDPFYRATYLVYHEKGEAYVQALIAQLRQKWGYWKADDVSLRLRQDEIKKRMRPRGNPQRVEEAVGGKDR